MGEQSYSIANVPITMDSIILDSPQLTDGTFEFEDESYFSNVYVPLSNFPTPPPSASDGGTRPHSSASCDGFQDPDSPLLGPSIHLSNLIPTAVSLLDPSPSLVLSLLKRAKLPIEILALAVCILDSLNSRFANIWRRSLPLSPQSTPQTSNYTFSPTPQTPHIDSIRPEIIILSALTLAQKFLDDEQTPTSFWAENIGQYRWTNEQINATEFAIMENLQWRILPLWNEERLAEALEDMEMAGRQAQALRFRQARFENAAENRMAGVGGGLSKSKNIPGALNIGTGQAIRGDLTQLLTPVETPSSSLEAGRGCSSSAADMMILGTGTTSFGASATRDQEFLLSSPRSCVREESTFPLFA